MKIGEHTAIYGFCEFRNPYSISIGSNCVIGAHNIIDGRNGIDIKNNVVTGVQVNIWTMEHDANDSKFVSKGEKVTINDYAWIASRSIILPGIVVGKGAVLASGAILTHHAEEYGFYKGIPAIKTGCRNRELTYQPGRHWWFV
jgi:acetyltransferase-like isoleucine patch superfamily enzyme